MLENTSNFISLFFLILKIYRQPNTFAGNVSPYFMTTIIFYAFIQVVIFIFHSNTLRSLEWIYVSLCDSLVTENWPSLHSKCSKWKKRKRRIPFVNSYELWDIFSFSYFYVQFLTSTSVSYHSSLFETKKVLIQAIWIRIIILLIWFHAWIAWVFQ